MMCNADEIQQYKINVANFELLEAEIAKLNRRAAKLGCPPAVLVVHGEFSKTVKNDLTGFRYTRTYKIVSVSGETPKLAGWKLVAAIEPQASGENLVSCVPGETVPVEYRTTDTHCDHCQSQRRRKEVFILNHEDGRFCQVGRQCISDHLGGKSPEGVLAYAAWGFDVERLCSEAEDEGSGFGSRGETGYNLEEFLKMTAAVIRRLGWVSRSVAAQFEGGGPVATANTVTFLLTPPWNADSRRERERFVEENKICLEERDEKLAAEALAWGIALPTDQGEYLYNLGVACRLGFVRHKTTGLVASLIAAYQRHLDREAELNMRKSSEAQKVRVHLGVVGERSGFAQVTVKAIRSFDSDYGVRTMIRFETAEGAILIWWKSGDTEWDEGETLDITGTVKKHDAWKDIPQTILQRVVKGLPKVKKTRKRGAA